MSILVVGSVALDDVETPFGRRESALGGAATYFGLAASWFTDIRVVAVVGEDFPEAHIELMTSRGLDLEGLRRESGETFRWGGRYGYDFNARETTFTDLNVFAEFDPEIPPAYRTSEYVFLANIAPSLQSRVLNQMSDPRIVALDTMNYWIEGTPDDLRRIVERVDIVIINDAETRELAQDPNIRGAATKILEWGPKLIVVKKGEHGAAAFGHGWQFAVPGLPLESIVDPTGAGDAFAGGFLGYLAGTADHGPESIRRATIYGSVMGSLCCETFSVDGLVETDHEAIESRFREFQDLTRFDHLPIFQDA